MSKWISTQKSMPKVGESIVITKTGDDEADYYLYVAFLTENNHFCTHDGLLETKEVTHWMPLPQPPND